MELSPPGNEGNPGSAGRPSRCSGPASILPGLFAFVILSASAPAAEPTGSQTATQIPDPAALEAADAVIGKIYFDIKDIFDTSDPRDDKALFRLANKLHMRTRESTLRAQLLFKEGDRYSQRVIDETERTLRRLDYLFDAHIRPVAWDGSAVDVLVETRDVWTLQPGINYQRKGGAESSGVEIEEENLLGYGKRLVFAREKDEERTSLTVEWNDPNLLGSRWRQELAYASSDDGHNRYLLIERPFFSLDTRWSAGFSATDNRRVDPRNDEGEVIGEFRHDTSSFEVHGGRSRGLRNGWALRWLGGFRYEEDLFAIDPDRDPPATLPPDRTVSYPWIGVEWIEDEYEETSNLDQIGRTEDVYYGTSLRLELGWSDETLGATRDSAILSASGTTSWRFTPGQSLLLAATGATRIESGELANASLSANARYYWRWQEKRVLFAGLQGTTTRNLDPENQLFLGGDTDLRGYPFKFQSGTSSAQFTLEQRFYTGWYPFRLFNVGAAIFFDAGRVWGPSLAGTASRGTLKNVGAGLRLGNTRSGFGSVIHLDIALPLDRSEGVDGVQFVVDTKRSF